MWVAGESHAPPAVQEQTLTPVASFSNLDDTTSTVDLIAGVQDDVALSNERPVETTPSEHVNLTRTAGPDTSLSMLHACVHCRASKTACTDQRPCNRCCRLGLECTSDGNQLRKRACRSCHAAKVACGTVFPNACGRCKRLGLVCVPREPPKHEPRRKRVRPLLSQQVGCWGEQVACMANVPLPAAQALVLAQHPATLAAHLIPIDLNRAAYMGASPTGLEASSRLASSGVGVRGSGCETTATSSMFSVASSLLDLSRPQDAAQASASQLGAPPGPLAPHLTMPLYLMPVATAACYYPPPPLVVACCGRSQGRPMGELVTAVPVISPPRVRGRGLAASCAESELPAAETGS